MAESGFSARRTFTFEDQRRFASLSGDRNPMHLDAVAARRTQAGAPVVHGIHLLLWAVDAVAASDPGCAPISRIKVRFNKFVYVGETAIVRVTDRHPGGAKLGISADGVAVSQIVIELGAPKQVAAVGDGKLPALALPTTAPEIEFEQMQGMSGRLPFATPPGLLADLFPAAAKSLGPQRLAALAASTNLVGMVCPGLHSIYGGLAVEACEGAHASDGIEFHVTSTEPRFRMVRMSIAGGGLTGSIDSFARVPPTAQASMASLANAVAGNEFAGSTALIVGGSRGIGELTAKLIAIGGGRVIVTYAVGKADAERVASEIVAAGGACEAAPYDVRKPAAEQLAVLAQAPTHLYYFATPAIFGRPSDTFSRRRLDEFLQVYVDGFWSLAQALRERRPDLSAFYPSSVAVDKRPRGMTEYAMAKVAGEALCADMNAALAPMRITVARLPRMETDQTATFMPVDRGSALETMLPLIRQVQAQTR